MEMIQCMIYRIFVFNTSSNFFSILKCDQSRMNNIYTLLNECSDAAQSVCMFVYFSMSRLRAYTRRRLFFEASIYKLQIRKLYYFDIFCKVLVRLGIQLTLCFSFLYPFLNTRHRFSAKDVTRHQKCKCIIMQAFFSYFYGQYTGCQNSLESPCQNYHLCKHIVTTWYLVK